MKPPPEQVDRYFTEQVVGPPVMVTLGLRASVRREPSRGVLVDPVSQRVALYGVAARSFLAPEPWRALAGTPMALPDIRPLRRWVAVAALLAWSLLLWALFYWWFR